MAKSRQNWTAEPWSDLELLKCAMVIPESTDCATIAFRAPSGGWFDYQPGQLLTLELPIPGGSQQGQENLGDCSNGPQLWHF